MLAAMQPLGEKLKELRKDRLLSQRDLARLANVSPATILKIEQGNAKRPHPGTLRKLADALEVEPKELRVD